MLLKKWGLKSDIASSGTEAINLIKEKLEIIKLYKVIFLDYSMPDMNGPECAK